MHVLWLTEHKAHTYSLWVSVWMVDACAIRLGSFVAKRPLKTRTTIILKCFHCCRKNIKLESILFNNICECCCCAGRARAAANFIDMYECTCNCVWCMRLVRVSGARNWLFYFYFSFSIICCCCCLVFYVPLALPGSPPATLLFVFTFNVHVEIILNTCSSSCSCRQVVIKYSSTLTRERRSETARQIVIYFILDFAATRERESFGCCTRK